MYSTVDRYDIKQHRELWATKAAVDAVKAGKPIPSGTVLTLVQYKAKVDDKGVPVQGCQRPFPEGRTRGLHRDGEAHRLGRRLCRRHPQRRVGVPGLQPREEGERQGEPQGLLPVPQAARGAGLRDLARGPARHGPGRKVMAQKGPDSVAIGDFTFGPETLERQEGHLRDLDQHRRLAAPGDDYRRQRPAHARDAPGPEADAAFDSAGTSTTSAACTRT